MSDIQQYGTEQGIGYYWIRQPNWVGDKEVQGSRRLVVIDEVGHVIPTGVHADDDPDAPATEDAVLEHLSDAVAQADANLERRRAKMPEPEPAPPPMDSATAKLYEDLDY